MPSDMFAPELFQSDSMNDAPSIFEQQGLLPMEHSSSPEFMRKDSLTTAMLSGIDGMMDEDENEVTPAKRKERSTKQRDPEKLKDTKHSSKNEGQHTDRRYLCYICNKLFTRRRSVRDHINKIHGEKTWEPTKSLEIVVEPHTGEPLEPIEEIVARGAQYPADVPKKASKSSKSLSKSDEGDEGDEDEVYHHALEQIEEEEAESVKPQFAIDPALDPTATTETPPLPELPSEPSFDPAPDPVPEPPKLKTESSQAESRPASAELTQPAQLIGKKRPLSVSKKGTAKVKSSTPNKRPKLVDAERSTPARSPSVTPAQRLGSKLRNSVHLGSPTSGTSSRQPSPSPTPSAATPASSNDDGEIFCICRRGDNHTWMIACDGPCEEWFHGKCVGIRERDGELIDKYICPRCEKDGFITTWKRMCRRKGCRKPARVKDNPPSKYCSVDCGRLFFVELIRRGDEEVETTKDGQFILNRPMEKKLRKKVKRERTIHNHSSSGTPVIGGSRPQTPAYSEDEKSEYETDSSADEEDLPNRGGPLRAGEVKAVLQQCRTVDAWRALGKKPATPPRDFDEAKAVNLEFDDYEQERLVTIKKEHAELDEKLSLLQAREKMLELINARSKTIVDDVKKSNPKQKDICGYDLRTALSEAEFVQWYRGKGKQILESGKIGPPEETSLVNGVEHSDDEKASTKKGGICIKNKCNKHNPNGKKWHGSDMREVKFEMELVKKKIDNLERQKHEIRSRAQVRRLEASRVNFLTQPTAAP